HDVLMGIITAYGTVMDLPGPVRDAGPADACECVCESKDDCVLAVRAAAAAFNAGIASEGKIDIECAGAAVDFSGYNCGQLHRRRQANRPTLAGPTVRRHVHRSCERSTASKGSLTSKGEAEWISYCGRLGRVGYWNRRVTDPAERDVDSDRAVRSRIEGAGRAVKCADRICV